MKTETVEVVDSFEPEILLYVEKGTDIIYEVQLFERFVLLRIATPSLQNGVQKMTHKAFERGYEEFIGDPEEARMVLENGIFELTTYRK
jgi:hypothetical protein